MVDFIVYFFKSSDLGIIDMLGLFTNTIIFLSLFFYRRGGAMYRWKMSLFAYFVMVLCIWTFIRILSHSDEALTYDGFELWWQGMFAVALVYNHGNIACLFDPRSRYRDKIRFYKDKF